jgi:bacillithiol synthase
MRRRRQEVTLGWRRQVTGVVFLRGESANRNTRPGDGANGLVHSLTRRRALCQSTALVHSHPVSSDSALRFAVDLRRLPWARRLAVDYAFDFERLARFFSGNPAEPDAWSAAIAAAREYPRERAAVAGILRAQLERRDAPPNALASAAALAEPGTIAIVTGQQAGLFGGPLFTLLKAVTAIRLAERIGRDHDVRAVPVFWIDAEDHDWDEVQGCTLLDAELRLRGIDAEPPPGAGERSVGGLVWQDGIRDAVEQLRSALPVTEHTPWLLDLIGRAYAPGITVADAFGRLLDGVLGPYGLVVFNAADPAAKPLLADVLARELSTAGTTALAAARAGADLVALGYHMQVTPHPGAAALFELSAGRRHVRRDGDEFIVGDDRRVPVSVLVDQARQRPQTFSPNVLLRPVVQDTLFPTACYVAGPNELAYLAQLRGVYEAFGLPMPLMHPRATATLLDAAGARFLTRYHVPLEALAEQNEHVLNELLKTLLPPHVEAAIRQAEARIGEQMDEVIAAVPAIDPTLEGRARSARGRMTHELETLLAKVLQAAKRRDDTLRRQFLHAREQAFPGGHAQERTVGSVAFLNRYGPALAARLLEELPLDGGTHWVVTI